MSYHASFGILRVHLPILIFYREPPTIDLSLVSYDRPVLTRSYTVWEGLDVNQPAGICGVNSQKGSTNCTFSLNHRLLHAPS